MTSQFRLYFERTLGIGCALTLLLAAPGFAALLLLLLWNPALNLVTRPVHRQWQACAAKAGDGFKGMLSGHISRECGDEPRRFLWQGEPGTVEPPGS